MIAKRLFRLAKSPLMGKAVGIAFQYFCGLIPVKKLFCSKDVLAFFHPQPCYENHIILSPRKPVRNLQQLSSAEFSRYFDEIWKAAQQICTAQLKNSDSFVLMANGGRKQDVQQVHFHLFTNVPMIRHMPTHSGVCVYHDDILEALEQPSVQEGRTHFVLLPVSDEATDPSAWFRSVLQTIDRLNAAFRLVENGYSLIYQPFPENNQWKQPVFHIVSARKA